jgi:hypothetical protein
MLNYTYTRLAMNSEFSLLKTKPGNYNASPCYNKIILSYQPHFFETENKMWENSDIQEKLKKNRSKYLSKPIEKLTEKELLRGFKISGLHNSYSHYCPLWIKAFIEEFNVKSIYDFCGGWGHRLLGSLSLEKYIYNDLNKKTFDGVNNIIKDFNITNSITYNEDCSSFTPKENYECVFTCPPYYKTEKYNYPEESSNKFSSYEDWLYIWWNNSVKSSLKKSVKYFAFTINNKYKDDMNLVCLNNGLKLIKTINIKLSTSHLNHNSNIKKGENILIYKKE